MPVISFTGRSASRASSASRSRTARAPNGLAESEISFASVRVRGYSNRRRHADAVVDSIANRHRQLQKRLPGHGNARKKNSSIE